MEKAATGDPGDYICRSASLVQRPFGSGLTPSCDASVCDQMPVAFGIPGY